MGATLLLMTNTDGTQGDYIFSSFTGECEAVERIRWGAAEQPDRARASVAHCRAILSTVACAATRLRSCGVWALMEYPA